MGRSDRALIIIPTYNERENLESLAEEILGLNLPVDILVVDDASPDGTGDLADKLSSDRSEINCLHRSEKSGLGSAYIDGMRWGLEKGYGWLIEMDADHSHSPRYLEGMLEAARSHDLVIGSRYIPGGGFEGWGWDRLLLSKTANAFVRLSLGMPFRDCTSGFRCFRRSALESIPLDEVISRGYFFQAEMLYRCWVKGLDIIEIPIVFVDRKMGQSKIGYNEVISGMMTVFKLRRSVK